MALFGNKKLSETDAAALFVKHLCLSIEEEWPALKEQLLRPLVGEDSVKLEDKFASSKVLLATIATQIQALPNLFPSDQSKRLRENILKLVSEKRFGENALKTIQEYQEAWDLALVDPTLLRPWDAIASLLHDKLELTKSISQDGYKSPLLLTALGTIISVAGGPWWKTIASRFKVVPS